MISSIIVEAVFDGKTCLYTHVLLVCVYSTRARYIRTGYVVQQGTYVILSFLLAELLFYIFYPK